MPSRQKTLIWILDDKGELASTVEDTLGSAYRYRQFLEASKVCEGPLGSEPALIIAEAEVGGSCISQLIKKFPIVPVIVISRCNDSKIISSCLESGVTDYFVKPVDPNMLSAKVRTIIKRRGLPQPKRISDLDFDIGTLTVSDLNGRRVKLTKKEFQIFERIAKAEIVGISPAELRMEIWGSFKVVSKSLDVHLFKLRRKIEPLSCLIRFNNVGRYHLLKEESHDSKTQSFIS